MAYNDTIIRQASSSLEGCNERQTSFLRWFHESGGWLNPKCRFADYETMGTGMVAGEAIENDEVLFSIPRHTLLNIQNSSLGVFCKAYDGQQKNSIVVESSAAPSTSLKWDDVNVGWQGLIMTMMWENFRATEEGRAAFEEFCQTNKEWIAAFPAEEHDTQNENEVAIVREARANMEWGPYLKILPQSFDTPMFWSDAEVEELKGTSIPNKIGKEEATAGFVEKVRPYIEEHASIFLGTLADKPGALDKYYSLEHFHMMGSRILSRSFHVKSGSNKDDRGNGDRSGEDDGENGGGDESDDDSDEEGAEEDESIDNISMVPMADMLNARYECDNAHLFYKTETLEMHATKRIEAGQQIWNTYGEPPSGDLLRRYGYVDLANPCDIVELPMESLIAGRLLLPNSPSKESLLARMAWACSLGMDEVSPLTYPFPLSPEPPYRPDHQGLTKRDYREIAMGMPDDLLVLARVLCLTEENYTKAASKDRLPNPKFDAVERYANGQEIGVTQILLKALEERKKDYPTSIEEDEQLLYPALGQSNNLSLNRRNAITVRLSEKYILGETAKMVEAVAEAVTLKRRLDSQANGSNGQNKKSRKA
ncbi:SET domain-containing protein [Meira miltonrushii]|uniref:SET domain-containing protein n=1 Tax=Meira miltonrushii TaxID=1280837 RepID=A0A316VA25_9BASI|nr:SET domain-containing protein [Meira miltonrushii]PWN34320.1 SET domain-containing protein [Meira miltonrushii]